MALQTARKGSCSAAEMIAAKEVMVSNVVVVESAKRPNESGLESCHSRNRNPNAKPVSARIGSRFANSYPLDKGLYN
jgi:hypothetical protein